MSIPDLWSLITGIASLLGLAFSLPKKSSAWRKYTIPITCVLGGIAIGRISVNLSQSVDGLFQDPYLLTTLIVFLISISLPAVLIVFMARRNYLLNPIILFLLTLMVASAIPEIYSAFKPAISAQDYLELAIVKEQKGNLTSAIEYYQKYVKTKHSVSDLEFKWEIEKKIDTLKTKQLKIINQN